MPCGDIHISDGGELIVGEPVAVKRQPIAQAGQAIAKAQSRAAVSGLRGTASGFVASGEEAADQSVRRERIARAAEDRRPEKSELKIRRRLKTDHLSMNKGLRIK